MRTSVETESKLVCPRDITEADVSATLNSMGLSVRWISTQRQVDTYLDTPDHMLIEAGAGLRVRRAGETYVGTLKLPVSQEDGIVDRHELEWEISRSVAETIVAKGVDLLRMPSDVVGALQRIGVRSVVPVLTASTIRRNGQAVGAEGFLAEIALDDTTFEGARGQSRQREIELELRHGGPSRLRDVTKRLIADLGLVPSRQSKYSVGMDKVG